MAVQDAYFSRGTRVYVGGLNEIVKKEDLEVEFEKYGKLNNVWVAFNPPGFAFIEFANCVDAETACDNLNGTEIMGCKLRVEISRGQGGGRGGYRGRGGGRGFFRGDSRGSYPSERSGFRRGRGSREVFRGRRGRYDDYGSSSGGSGYASSRGGGYGGRRGYGQSSNRDSYDGNSYYGGRESGSSRDRCRSPVGRESSRDYGRLEDTFGYGRSSDDN